MSATVQDITRPAVELARRAHRAGGQTALAHDDGPAAAELERRELGVVAFRTLYINSQGVALVLAQDNAWSPGVPS